MSVTQPSGEHFSVKANQSIRAFEAQTFDAVVMLPCLNHFKDKNQALREAPYRVNRVSVAGKAGAHA